MMTFGDDPDLKNIAVLSLDRPSPMLFAIVYKIFSIPVPNNSTLKFLDSKNACRLSKRLQHLQASVAFFLSFHDVTTHMRRPFKYPPRIAHFG